MAVGDQVALSGAGIFAIQRQDPLGRRKPPDWTGIELQTRIQPGTFGSPAIRQTGNRVKAGSWFILSYKVTAPGTSFSASMSNLAASMRLSIPVTKVGIDGSTTDGVLTAADCDFTKIPSSVPQTAMGSGFTDIAAFNVPLGYAYWALGNDSNPWVQLQTFTNS